MDSQLSIKVGEGVEAMGVVKATLILTVAALHLAVVPRRIRPDQLVPNTEFGGGFLKE